MVAALSALAYSWQVGSTIETFYAAAMRSMTESWHNFLFGAFDPSGTIMVDKLPAAMWVQALSARPFGYHVWSLMLPQAVEGVLTVLVLYHALRRLAGPLAGLAAFVVLAASPATMTLDRGNIPDSLMILLLVLAADSTVTAVLTGHRRSVVMVGVWVALAFQAKMLEAWLVLPALGLAYLVAARGTRHAARGTTWARLGCLVAIGAVTVVVSLSYNVRHPHPRVATAARGRQHEQLRVPTGVRLQRLLAGGSGVAQPRARPDARDALLLPGRAATGVEPAAHPQLRPGHGLAPAGGGHRDGRHPRGAPKEAPHGPPARRCAAVGDLAAGAGRGGQHQHDHELVLRGRSVARNGGFLGIGSALAWEHRGEAWVAVVTAGTVQITVGYATWILPTRGTGLPNGLAAAIVLGVLAVVAEGRGPFDTPFQSTGTTTFLHQVFAPQPSPPGLASIEAARRGAPYLMAAQTSAVAAPFIYATGEEVLPLGGYTGTIPAPSIAAMQAMIAAGDFHLVLVASPGATPSTAYIVRHCLHVAPRGNKASVALVLKIYYCLPSSA